MFELSEAPFKLNSGKNEILVRVKAISSALESTFQMYSKKLTSTMQWLLLKITLYVCMLCADIRFQNLCLFYVKNWLKWKKLKFRHLSSLLISFSRVKSSSYPKKLAEGGQKKVRLNECSSYPRFELTGDFYKEVLRKFQGTQENS